MKQHVSLGFGSAEGGSCMGDLLPRSGRTRLAVLQGCRYILIVLLGACGCVLLTLLHHFDAAGFGTDNVCVTNSTADYCYCEHTRLLFGSVIVYQPSNSFSCLFYCAFAGVVGALWLNRLFPSREFLGLDVNLLADHDAKKLDDGDYSTAGASPITTMRDNEFSRGEARAWFYVMSLAALGSLSWAKHALLDTVGGVLDLISMDFLMICVVSTDVSQAVVDGNIWQTDHFGGTGNFVFFSLVVIFAVPLITVRVMELEKETVGVQGMFAMVMSLACVVHLMRLFWERWKDGVWSRDISLLPVSLLSFGIAFAFRYTACDTQSPWQGHAAWHFFSALAAALWVASHATHRRGFWCFERMIFIRLSKSFVTRINKAPESRISFFASDSSRQDTTSDDSSRQDTSGDDSSRQKSSTDDSSRRESTSDNVV